MNLPYILVIDDQLARDNTEQARFLESIELSAGNRYAAIWFCRGQRIDGNLVLNDYAVVREQIEDVMPLLVLLDMRFDSGSVDEDGRILVGSIGDDDFGGLVLRGLQRDFPGLPVVLLTGVPQKDINGVDGYEADYLSKVNISAYSIKRMLLRHAKLDPAQTRSLLKLGDDICAADTATLQTFTKAFEHSASDAGILILGPSGAGKEVLSNYIHRMSMRSNGPYVQINVASLTPSLIESELFGIDNRVATDVSARIGLFESANGGTLLLDEVGDLPLETQTKLLRVLQEKAVRRVGGRTDIPVNVRVICATSKDIPSLLASGSLRKDFLYRINTIVISVQALEQRRADIRPLAKLFLKKFSRSCSKALTFKTDALDYLERLAFPGNVRELRSLIERIVSLADHNQEISIAAIDRAGGGDFDVGVLNEGDLPVLGEQKSQEVFGLGQLSDFLHKIVVRADDPELRGALVRLDEATNLLRKRLVGAGLEYCRNRNDNSLNKQGAMQYLTGRNDVNGKEPGRLLKTILGKRQADELDDSELEDVIKFWKELR